MQKSINSVVIFLRKSIKYRESKKSLVSKLLEHPVTPLILLAGRNFWHVLTTKTTTAAATTKQQQQQQQRRRRRKQKQQRSKSYKFQFHIYFPVHSTLQRQITS
jgi:hypothetical protein